MDRQQQIEHFLMEAHHVALRRLREQPQRLQDVVAQLSRWRAQAGATRSDPYWDEWSELLHRDLDAIERAVVASTDHAAALRSVSPMSVLISQRERAELLQNARRAA
ncbi:MAG: hypothetical protein ACRECD_07760 [Burkholderiaceae bacterium]